MTNRFEVGGILSYQLIKVLLLQFVGHYELSAEGRKSNPPPQDDGSKAKEVRRNAELVHLSFLVDSPQALANVLVEVHSHQLEVHSSLVDDIKTGAVVCPKSLVRLKDPLNQPQCDGVLDITAEMSQKEQAFLDYADVRHLQNA